MLFVARSSSCTVPHPVVIYAGSFLCIDFFNGHHASFIIDEFCAFSVISERLACSHNLPRTVHVNVRTAAAVSRSSAELVMTTRGGAYHTTLPMPTFHVRMMFDILSGLAIGVCIAVSAVTAEKQGKPHTIAKI